MYIKYLNLRNFRSFTDTSIWFVDETKNDQPSKIVVFIGNNGAGKTAILDALKINLSWLVARINHTNANGIHISDMDIQNGETYADISLKLKFQDEFYQWRLAKTLRGSSKITYSNLGEANHLATMLQNQLSLDVKNAALPMIVYYPCERTVVEIPLKIKTHHSFGQLDGYDNALKQGADFRRFFEWFREREDKENEAFSNELKRINQLIKKNQFDSQEITKEIDQLYSSTGDRQLNSVRIAIKAFMSEFENLRITRNSDDLLSELISPPKPFPFRLNSRSQMLVDKNGKTLDVAQLSQGEKSMMALVGDIARRLAIMNPGLENPLTGFGIVLIDEIDLHLHPNWQRAIIGNLSKTFPNCQFILTTHSPIVISESPNLLCYSLENGEIEKLPNLFGMDVNQVLLQDMDADIRNIEIQRAIDELRDSLQDGQLNQSKLLLAELEQKIAGDNLELTKAKLLIKRLEAQRAVNH